MELAKERHRAKGAEAEVEEVRHKVHELQSALDAKEAELKAARELRVAVEDGDMGTVVRQAEELQRAG